MRKASGNQGEYEWQWKKVNKNTYISPRKRVTRKVHVVVFVAVAAQHMLHNFIFCLSKL